MALSSNGKEVRETIILANKGNISITEYTNDSIVNVSIELIDGSNLNIDVYKDRLVKTVSNLL